MQINGAAPASARPAGNASLRLSVPPGALERLREAPMVMQHVRNRGVVRRLHAIYYDTAEHALFGSGLSLRVQQHGKRYMQTLHQHGARRPLLPAGATWQAEVGGLAPDLAHLAQLAGISVDAPLLALFETRLRRHRVCLDLAGTLLDVSFDDGAIEAGGREQALREIGITLRSGETGVLWDLGLRLLELAPLRIAAASTVRRGYAMACGDTRKAEKAGPSSLTRDLAVDEMIGAVLSGCMEHLRANQFAVEDGRNPDGVHQMRVALRRMRSALSLLRRELSCATMTVLADEAKWAAGELEAARAWDVFLGNTLVAPQRGRTCGADFAALRQVAETPRAAGYEAVRDLLGSARYGRLQLSVNQWIARRGWRNELDPAMLPVLAEPAAALANRVLTRLHRKALKLGSHFKRLSGDERHQLRIALKRLRYASEFFLPLVCQDRGQDARHFLNRLAHLQDTLGVDHDAVTTQPLLDIAGRLGDSPGLHQAIGRVAGWQARDRIAAGEQLIRDWRRFKAMPPFWATPEAT